MKAVGATLCPPLRPAETEIMIRPPPLPTADHGCTAASWPGREGGRGDDLLATPLYLSHMSRPQLGQTWEDPGPTDLTLFASPSAAQCPPVSPALPSNRQDFFSVKFLIIRWLGPGLEAGARCDVCNQHLIVSALLSSAHCPGEGCQAGLSGSLKLLLVWRYQFLSVPLRPTTDFGCKNCSCLKYNAFWISNVISRMRNPAELQKWIWTIYIEQINLVFMLMTVKIFHIKIWPTTV